MNPSHSYSGSGIRILLVTVFLMVLCITAVSANEITLGTSGTINNWVITSGGENTNPSFHLTVVADNHPWYIKVKDGLNNDKPLTSEGHMTEWDGSSYVTNPHVLINNMTVQASSGSGYSPGSAASLSTTDKLIVTGETTASTVDIPIVITQPVESGDANLTATTGHTYRIVVTYSGGFV